MAIKIDVDGTETTVVPTNGRTFNLQELYKHIECSMVELVRLDDGRLMWLDEEGKFTTKLPNVKATGLLMMAGGIPGDIVVGPVLITDGGEIE